MEQLKRLFEDVADMVSELMGLNRNNLFSSLSEQYVDGRSLLVNWLINLGYTESMLVEYTGMSQQRVNFLKNSFERRKVKFSVRLALQEINKRFTKDLQSDI